MSIQTDPQSLKNLSQEELLKHELDLVAEERRVQLALIECLREVERRSLFLLMGHSSMWDFCIEFLRLSEGMAQRHLSTMRLTKEVPGAKEALESGVLTLSNASRLQTFFRSERKQGVDRTPEKKAELIREILKPAPVSKDPVQRPVSAGISQKELERKLAELAPHVQLNSEKTKPIGNGKTELTLILDDSVMKELEELRNLWGHRFPQAGFSEIISAAIAEVFERAIRKVRGRDFYCANSSIPSEGHSSANSVDINNTASGNTASDNTAAAAVDRRPNLSPKTIGVPASLLRKPLPVATKQAVWRRAGGQCEEVATVGPFLGRRCSSRFSLEIDHQVSVAKGGTNELSNLLLLCSRHHRYKTKKEFPHFKSTKTGSLPLSDHEHSKPKSRTG